MSLESRGMALLPNEGGKERKQFWYLQLENRMAAAFTHPPKFLLLNSDCFSSDQGRFVSHLFPTNVLRWEVEEEETHRRWKVISELELQHLNIE